MPEKNQASDIRRSLVSYAGNILGRRPYFSDVLRKKLILRATSKGFIDFENIVDSIIQDLASAGFLDDDYLARSYIKNQLHKGWGPKVIFIKMKRLGLAENLVKACIQEEAGLEVQMVSIRHYLKKLSRYERRQQINKFFQRGFHSSAILNVFDGGASGE